jgi:hypothetical protein
LKRNIHCTGTSHLSGCCSDADYTTRGCLLLLLLPLVQTIICNPRSVLICYPR